MSLRASQLAVTLKLSLGSCYKLITRLEDIYGKFSRDAAGKMVDPSYLPLLERAAGYVNSGENISCYAAIDRAIDVQSKGPQELMSEEELLISVIEPALIRFLKNRPDLPDVKMGSIYHQFTNFKNEILSSAEIPTNLNSDQESAGQDVDAEAPAKFDSPKNALQSTPTRLVADSEVKYGISERLGIKDVAHLRDGGQPFSFIPLSYFSVQTFEINKDSEFFCKNANLYSGLELFNLFGNFDEIFPESPMSELAKFKYCLDIDVAAKADIDVLVGDRGIDGQIEIDEAGFKNLMVEVRAQDQEAHHLFEIGELKCNCFLHCDEVKYVIEKIDAKIFTEGLNSLKTEEKEFFVIATFIRTVIKENIRGYILSPYGRYLFMTLSLIGANIPEHSNQMIMLGKLWDEYMIRQNANADMDRQLSDEEKNNPLAGCEQELRITANEIGIVMPQLYSLARDKLSLVRHVMKNGR